MKALAPGKIIISGEHAVVYGNSALVMAVNRYSYAHIDRIEEHRIKFSLPDLHSFSPYPVDEMQRKYELLIENYRQFVQGKIDVKNILTSPVELFIYVVMHFLERYAIKPDAGMHITISSALPSGCGMGSSAATIVSLVKALSGFWGVEDDPDIQYNLALDAEKLQHGNSSGVDPYIAIKGGFVKFQKKQPTRLQMPDLQFFIVNTGTPAASTGESVAAVARKFRTSTIWEEFQTVTDAFERAILAGNKQMLTASVRENHRLLCSIGVVPTSVQNFIAELEEQGGAGKISGAGSVTGEHAGIVLVTSEQSPELICSKYNYQLISLKGEQNGARFV